MKSFVGALLAGALCSAGPALAAGPTAEQYGLILNLAGRQRMLSQKMAKETLMVAAGIDAKENRQNLISTTELFRKTMKGLRDGDEAVGLPACEDDTLRGLLDGASDHYKAVEHTYVRTIAGETPNPDELNELGRRTSELLEKLEFIMTVWNGHANKVLSKGAVATTINIAGRQRMLTQKASKEAMLVHMGIASTQNRGELRKTISLFDKVLNGLRKGDKDFGITPTDNAAILAQLEVVDKHWGPFHAVLKKQADSTSPMPKAEAEAVAKLNGPLLKEMNRAVELYEGLSGGGVAKPAAAAGAPAAAPKRSTAKR